MEFFHYHFPEVARKETRSIILEGEKETADALPSGFLALVESYCTDPACDCRRVMFHVLHPDLGPVAVIGFGFDASAPYAEPMLDPLNPQSQYADQVLALVRDIALSEPAYVARLQRHYGLMKEKFAASPQELVHRPKQSEERWWKRKRRKPRR
jgi:hypothetical protein